MGCLGFVVLIVVVGAIMGSHPHAAPYIGWTVVALFVVVGLAKASDRRKAARSGGFEMDFGERHGSHMCPRPDAVAVGPSRHSATPADGPTAPQKGITPESGRSVDGAPTRLFGC